MEGKSIGELFHESDKYPYRPISPIWMIVYALLSFCFFSIINRYKPLLNKSSSDKKSAWPQQNTFISFIHSFLSSIMLTIAVIRTPAIIDDVFSYANHFTYAALSFSLGYFIWDFIDCSLNASTSIVGIIVHHLVAVAFFGYILFNTRYLGLAVYGLSPEINSMFLHSRRLFRWCRPRMLSGQSYEIVRYTITVGNYMTFIIFRFGATGLGYLKFHYERHKVSLEIYLFITLVMLTVYYLNVVLFYRLIKNDIMLSKSTCNDLTDESGNSATDEMLSTT